MWLCVEDRSDSDYEGLGKSKRASKRQATTRSRREFGFGVFKDDSPMRSRTLRRGANKSYREVDEEDEIDGDDILPAAKHVQPEEGK